MPYNQLINTIQKQYENNGITNHTIPYSYTFIPDQGIPSLIIRIPGKKYNSPNQFDYKVEIDGEAWKHEFIQQALYEKVKYSTNPLQEFLLINSILMDILNIGPLQYNQFNTFSITLKNKDYNYMQFSTIIYWLIGQEEINYPSPRFLGKRLPIIRYQEAAIGPLLSIDINALTERTNNHGKKPPALLENLEISINNLSFEQILALYFLKI